MTVHLQKIDRYKRIRLYLIEWPLVAMRIPSGTKKKKKMIIIIIIIIDVANNEERE